MLKQNRAEKEEQKKAAEEKERAERIERITQEHLEEAKSAQEAIRDCSASNEKFTQADYVIDDTGQLKFKKTFIKKAYRKVDQDMK